MHPTDIATLIELIEDALDAVDAAKGDWSFTPDDIADLAAKRERLLSAETALNALLNALAKERNTP